METNAVDVAEELEDVEVELVLDVDEGEEVELIAGVDEVVGKATVEIGALVMLKGVGAMPSKAFAQIMVPSAGAVVGITVVAPAES